MQGRDGGREGEVVSSKFHGLIQSNDPRPNAHQEVHLLLRIDLRAHCAFVELIWGDLLDRWMGVRSHDGPPSNAHSLQSVRIAGVAR